MKKSDLLTPKMPSALELSTVSLFLRISVGVAMLVHGIPKLISFSTLANTFPDPIGLGSTLSLIMAIGAELICSLMLIFGLFTRLASIPLIFNMFVIFFIVHASTPFIDRELPLLYLVIYIVILIIGPGNYSLDKFILKNE